MAKLVLPKVVHIEVMIPGREPWRPRVLLETATRAVAMECTAANFHTLFELVSHDLMDGGGGKASSSGGQAAFQPTAHSQSRAPRGSKAKPGNTGSREPGIASSWIPRANHQTSAGSITKLAQSPN